MKTIAATPSVHQRILATAMELFYRQGYRATGINQVIAESGVAKASFYDHFPSKDDLLVAYAAEMARREFEELRAEVEALPTPRDRFFGPLDVLVPWLESTGYRGCPFQNLAAELAGDVPHVHEIARQHRENVRGLIRAKAIELTAAEPALGALAIEDLTDMYLLLFEGAIATAVAYRQPWPVEKARATIERQLVSSRPAA